MNLAIDIGNTLAKFGYFEGSKLVEYFILDRWNTARIYGSLQNESKIIVSKTAHRFDRHLKVLGESFELISLNHDIPLPIVLDYKTPETLGRDRIAVAVAAFKLFPGQSTLVIDAGTCITYDFVDKDGKYHGGQITPGVRMRLEAMHHFTDKLPLVDWKDHFERVGKSTEECLISGAVLGTINEMEGFIGDYNTAFNKINICITGGDSQFFVLNMKTEILAVPSLALQGLNEILNFNA